MQSSHDIDAPAAGLPVVPPGRTPNSAADVMEKAPLGHRRLASERSGEDCISRFQGYPNSGLLKLSSAGVLSPRLTADALARAIASIVEAALVDDGRDLLSASLRQRNPSRASWQFLAASRAHDADRRSS